MNRRMTLLAVLCLVPSAAAIAGPLEPPAGPVAPSMKTLQQIEARTPVSVETTPGDAASVYRITQPGSYYLVGDLAAEPGKSVVHITAANVTLDLNSFTINATGGLSGVSIGSNATNAVVRNGTIRSAPQWAIAAAQSGFTLVEGITVRDGGGAGTGGIAMFYSSAVRGCRVLNVTGTGIRTGVNSLVAGCVIDGANEVGISVSTAGIVESCTIRSAGNSGVANAAGIRLGSSAIARGCTLYQCGTVGIYASGADVIDCQMVGVSGVGIYATDRAVVRGCAVAYSTVSGVLVAGPDCRVVGNHITSTGTQVGDAGIQVAAGVQRAHLEGNTGAGNRRGIDVDGTNCLIIGNSFSGAAAGDYAYSFGAGNRFGPVVSPGTGGAIVATGGSAAGTLGSTDPYANLCY